MALTPNSFTSGIDNGRLNLPKWVETPHSLDGYLFDHKIQLRSETISFRKSDSDVKSATLQHRMESF